MNARYLPTPKPLPSVRSKMVHECTLLLDTQPARSFLKPGFETNPIEAVENEQDRWLKFFVEGERLDDEHLPAWMQTEEMHQAMSTLKTFSEKERAYHEYQARQNYLRQQKSIENRLNALHTEIEQVRTEIEQARAAEEQARAAEEQARAAEKLAQAEKEAALAEIERLKALLLRK